MTLFVANTDADWARHLSTLAARPDGLDEANFWRPSGRVGFKALSFGEPLVFKLKKAHGHAIVGFGLFAAFRRLTIREAWTAFGEANGAATEAEVLARVGRYVQSRGEPLTRAHRIGCILLAAPVFFPRDMWVAGPSDWSDNTVQGKGYDSTAREGRRIWRECLDRAALLNQAADLRRPTVAHDIVHPATLTPTDPPERYGTPQVVRPRLGQSTFRYAIEQAYGRCAVTGEHSLPALDAAHITPYSDGGNHALDNGLLLRADVHRLFDAGYVTVTPDYAFRVSRRLREDYDNGKVYYQHDGDTIWTPAAPYPKPDPGRLEWHSTERFLDA